MHRETSMSLSVVLVLTLLSCDDPGKKRNAPQTAGWGMVIFGIFYTVITLVLGLF